MCNYERGHHGQHSCEVTRNSDQWFRRRCCLKDFLSGALAAPFVQQSRTICAILKEGIMGNIHVKLYEIWTSILGGDVKKKFTDPRTQDGRRPITIAHLEPLAQVS